MPDRWELANGFDPLTPGEDALDPDKDGLTTADEYGYNTNPKQNDSDGDGENDFFDVSQIGNPEEFLELRLVTRDTGKVINSAMNCAECHTTQLRVGDFTQLSSEFEALSEKTIYLRKGTNYPIHLNRIVRNQPRPNAAIGAPYLNTAAYTAGIVPAGDAPRAYILQDPQTRLGTNKPSSNFPADITAAIGSLIVPKIEVTFTNLSGNVALDANPNWGGGIRIFPDALNPNDFTARNAITVVVRTTPPLAGQVVRLRSIDVDDPNPTDMNPGGVLDSNDASELGSGNDNRGTPQAGQLAQTTLTLDSQGRATTTLTVTKQPGDNFRIAAVLDTPNAATHLNALQVFSADDDYYVSADNNAIPGFVGGLSPMITVWRKLHLEFDSMAAPPASGLDAIYASGSITSFRPNYPVAGRSQLQLSHNNISGTDYNLFERGKLEITGIGTYRVLQSAFTAVLLASGAASTTVEIEGAPAGAANGTTVKLYDDDDRFLSNDPPLYSSGLGLQSPSVPALHHVAPCLATNAPKFADAYIALVDANARGFSTGTLISFKRQAGPAFFDVGNQQLKGTDRPDFWAYTVVFGYEPEIGEDGDPNGEAATLGETQKSLSGLFHSFSVVFLEPNREIAFQGVPVPSFASQGSTNSIRSQYVEELYLTVAHEIGHAPKSWRHEYFDHKESGLMGTDPGRARQRFTPKTLLRFRETTQWTR